MAKMPWWLANALSASQGQSYTPPTYIPPHTNYLSNLNSVQQRPQIGGPTALNSTLLQLLAQRLNGNQQTWPMQSMHQPQLDPRDYNAWDYIRSQVAYMQLAQTTPKYPQSYGYPMSSPDIPKFHTPRYSTERQWGTHHYAKPHEQNIDQELVQEVVARWKEGARQAMNIRSQQELQKPPSQLFPNQAVGQKDQSQETKQPVQCHMLHEPAIEHPDHHEEKIVQEEPLGLIDGEETEENESDHESILTWECESDCHLIGDPLLEIDSKSDTQYPLFEQHVTEGPNT